MSTILDHPDPRTVASIRLQGLADHFDGYNCGCHERPVGSDHWFLCDYHDGFEDALDEYAPLEQP